MYNIWEKDITYLKGVGPKRSEVLRKECRIRNYGDLLHYYPRKYVDRSRVSKVRDIRGEEPFVILIGKLTRLDLSKT
ncbi:MAG: ATP-dependent DNA helicase RecG, partial [Bacteroidetes bacterium]|nr:ATP-dependent DNA helicase RecG [Bacteroidota bacterium]